MEPNLVLIISNLTTKNSGVHYTKDLFENKKPSAAKRMALKQNRIDWIFSRFRNST